MCDFTQKNGPTTINDGGRAARCAPETIRTSDRWYRKPVLYPLSYGGNAVTIAPWVHGTAKPPHGTRFVEGSPFLVTLMGCDSS